MARYKFEQNAISLASESFLAQYFGAYGSKFPYTNGGVDYNINTNTTWSVADKYRKAKTITIAAGVTLRIDRSPFVIFADTINFGGADSFIDISGDSGGAAVSFSTSRFAVGGLATSGSARAQAGCGGGFLIVVANSIIGSAGGFKASGGDGYINSEVAAANSGQQGYGAMSYTPQAAGVSESAYSRGSTMFELSLAQGYGLNAGGSGFIYVNSEAAGSGSGIGSGGYIQTLVPYAGRSAYVPQSLWTLLELFKLGCLGGGGGGAWVDTDAGYNMAGGGGGGALIVITKNALITPTLTANGGTGVKGASTGGVVPSGGAGVTKYIVLP
ncbi:MAG: hypothetical protein HPY50_04870 [Firmicutes bacterium]|nr:hypothetical protein [Bacillota bacterium]